MTAGYQEFLNRKLQSNQSDGFKTTYLPDFLKESMPMFEIASMYQPKIEIIDVTRSIAIEIMKMNTENRPNCQRSVDLYAMDMLAGKFPLNGETIKISTSGKVLDGQHRLAAIIKSGVTIRMIVVSGLPDSVYSTIDTGRKRTAGDTLAVKGIKNYNAVAAAVKWVYAYRKTIEQKAVWVSVPELTNEKVLNFVETEPLIVDVVAEIRGLVPRSMVLGSPVCGICYEIVRKNNADEMRDFIVPVLKGNDLIEGTAQYAIRSKLINNALSRAKLKGYVVNALIILAWNAHKLNRSVKLIRWNMGEKFPEIL